MLSSSNDSGEFISFLENQQKLLRAHPYQKLTDAHEIEMLEAKPSAPEYLSSYINQWEKKAAAAQTEEERNRRAANLHRSVRTTRYGCNKDGTHASYSRESFKLLHTRYGDTPWAKATPYWFK